jgi:hypothetical protein
LQRYGFKSTNGTVNFEDWKEELKDEIEEINPNTMNILKALVNYVNKYELLNY